jgi:hypothetical protein
MPIELPLLLVFCRGNLPLVYKYPSSNCKTARQKFMLFPLSNTELPRKKITHWKPLPSRPKGRPKKKREDVLQDLRIMKIQSSKTCLRRQEQWKAIVELAKTHDGLYNCYTRRNCKLVVKLNSVAVVRKRTIPIERPPLVGEVTANLCRSRMLRSQREFSRPLISVF